MRTVWSTTKKSSDAQGWFGFESIVTEADRSTVAAGVVTWKPYRSDGERFKVQSYARWLAWATPLCSRGMAVCEAGLGVARLA